MRPKPLSMPKISAEANLSDYLTVKTSKENMYGSEGANILIESLWHCCLNTEIDRAEPFEIKEIIFRRAQHRLKLILDRGERYVVLLHAACVQNGLEAATFSSKPQQVRTFDKVCRDFAEWWRTHPRQRSAHIFAEYLTYDGKVR